MSAKKPSTQRRRGAEKLGSAAVPAASTRACLRCGCTDALGCAQVYVGRNMVINPSRCCWIEQSNVCSACLSYAEWQVWMELRMAMLNANVDQLRARAVNRLQTFARYLNESSADMPIPYKVVKGTAK